MDEILDKYGYEPCTFRVRLLDYYGNIGNRVSIRHGYIPKNDWKEERKAGKDIIVSEYVFNTTYSKEAIIKKINNNKI